VKIYICISLALIAMCSGCTRRLSVTTADGSTATYSNTGFDTSLGELVIERDPESGRLQVRVQGFDSQTQAFDALGKGFQAVQRLAPLQ